MPEQYIDTLTLIFRIIIIHLTNHSNENNLLKYLFNNTRTSKS